jgi:hypothetical protein
VIQIAQRRQKKPRRSGIPGGSDDSQGDANMGNVSTMSENVDFNEVMTAGEVGKLIRRSDETVRQLADRSWHPIPHIDTGLGKKKQRLFRRTSVLRWLEEEESGASNKPTARLSGNGAGPNPAPARTTRRKRTTKAANAA